MSIWSRLFGKKESARIVSSPSASPSASPPASPPASPLPSRSSSPSGSPSKRRSPSPGSPTKLQMLIDGDVKTAVDTRSAAKKAEDQKTTDHITTLVKDLLNFDKPEVATFWRNQVRLSGVGGGTKDAKHLMPHCISGLLQKKSDRDRTENDKYKRLASESAKGKNYLSFFFSSSILRTRATHDFVTALSQINPERPDAAYKALKEWKEKTFDVAVKAATPAQKSLKNSH